MISTLIVLVVGITVPRADPHSLALHTPWVRIPGLVILQTATAFTLWARLALGTMWSAAPTVRQEHKLRITPVPHVACQAGDLTAADYLASHAFERLRVARVDLKRPHAGAVGRWDRADATQQDHMDAATVGLLGDAARTWAKTNSAIQPISPSFNTWTPQAC